MEFSGTGPGPQTFDGCSVDFYRQLPYQGELEEILPLLPPRATVLELGCGTGRLAGRLTSLGHRVVGVDHSDDMLRHLPEGVEGVHASIESLRLPQRFSVVLLPSLLINHPAAQVRQAFVQCARRHLAEDGRFFLQCHDPHWLRSVQPGPLGTHGGVTIHADHVERTAEGVRMTLVYRAFGQAWAQTFSARPLEEGEIETLVKTGGFTSVEWHGSKRLWASATLQTL